MDIGALAKAAGCDVTTIRYYEHEREGLLAAVPRSAAGYRQYGPAALERLNFIRHCRSLDMPLADVRRLAESDLDGGCGEVDALVDAHIARVRARLASLRALEAQLLRLRANCGVAQRGVDCGIVASLRRAAQDEACACHEAGG